MADFFNTIGQKLTVDGAMTMSSYTPSVAYTPSAVIRLHNAWPNKGLDERTRKGINQACEDAITPLGINLELGLQP
jgi:hypothetical protein